MLHVGSRQIWTFVKRWCVIWLKHLVSKLAAAAAVSDDLISRESIDSTTITVADRYPMTYQTESCSMANGSSLSPPIVSCRRRRDMDCP